MKIPRFAGFAAGVCLALATPVIHAQSASGSSEQAKAAKPMVVVSRMIDGKSMKLSGTNNWHRIEVEVKALPDGIRDALLSQGIPKQFAGESVRWVNKVKVTLVAGYQPTSSDLGKPKVMQDVLTLKDKAVDAESFTKARNAKLIENWRFFKATATVLTLEANVPRSVFFYIPGDVVKRDDIFNPKPDVAYVTLEVDGKEVPLFTEAGSLYTGSFGVLFGGSLGKPSKVTFDKVKEVADRSTRDTDGVMRPQNLLTPGIQDSDWFRYSPEFIREEASK